MAKGDVKSNQLIVGSLVVIALLVAYYLLMYLPKQQELRLQQQETSLRKQTYEICLKEWSDYYDLAADYVNKEIAKKQLTQYMTDQEWKQEMSDKLMPIINIEDEMISNCVGKRLQEYKGQ